MNHCNDPFRGVSFFSTVMRRNPHSYAVICGSSEYPHIHGQVRLYQTNRGTLVVTEVFGLPKTCKDCENAIFAYHIHEGGVCAGSCSDPFGQAMSHYNPSLCEHPNHAGDLPPLFGNDGYAFSAFLTENFSACEVVGKTILIHRALDDFTSQPSGNSGARIACGVIRAF